MFSSLRGPSYDAARPHPAIARVTARGYELEVQRPGEGDPGGTLTVRARVGPVVVATVALADRPGGLVRTGVWVADGHTGRGLSTALHVFAEAVSGKPIAHFWGDDDRPHEGGGPGAAGP